MTNNINLLYYRDLVARGYGNRTTIWRKVKAGELPKPIDCGGRPAWPEVVMVEWLDSKINQTTAQR